VFPADADGMEKDLDRMGRMGTATFFRDWMYSFDMCSSVIWHSIFLHDMAVIYLKRLSAKRVHNLLFPQLLTLYIRTCDRIHG
jgi:hypothetical protein